MSSPLDFPCNPAFLAIEDRKGFETHVFLRNNVDYFKDAIQVIQNKADTETVRELFSQTKDARFEADLEANDRFETWAVSVSPSRLSYYSLVRNRVLPYLSLFAAQEHILRLQKAWSYSDQMSFGIQLRGLYRRLILSDAFITEAAAEGGAETLLRVQHQTLVFAEPSLVWTDPSLPWQPQVGLMFTQTGWVSKKIEGLQTDPEAELGASFQPFENQPELKIGPQFSFNSEAENWGDHARMGIQYQMSDQHLFQGSFSSFELNLGYALKWQQLHAGIIWELQRVENLIGEKDQLQTWSLQLGSAFD